MEVIWILRASMVVMNACTVSATTTSDPLPPAADDCPQLPCSMVAGMPETISRLYAAGQSMLKSRMNICTSGTCSFMVPSRVLNFAIMFRHVVSYSFALMKSRTYALSRYSTVLIRANRSALLFTSSRSFWVFQSFTSPPDASAPRAVPAPLLPTPCHPMPAILHLRRGRALPPPAATNTQSGPSDDPRYGAEAGDEMTEL
mmetsp:Transcript_14781/g.28454  ORF Transcript_14781/g.28454 Transcript_14781/m.28454 type:complete len:201 (-) Transcript_14781:816-1418(-)